MKLKGLGKRAYNVLFHTHTVSGIVISAALFIIFYAGAYALFRDEIMQWEDPAKRESWNENMDFDRGFQAVDSVFEGLAWSETTTIRFPHETDPYLKIYGAVPKTDSTTKRMAAAVHTSTYAVSNLREAPTTVGNTIYFLHYFRQIPFVGLYISGLVALFFLFASITGLLIHWKNLFTKFFAFIKEGKWKTIWTNLHTVLGVIGLPFQVMYAVTGAFFGLLALILLPSVVVLYEGDSQQVFNKITPSNTITLDPGSPAADNIPFTTLLGQIEAEYPGYEISRVTMRNYGKEDALVTWTISDMEGLMSSGSLTMFMKDGIVLEDVSIRPTEKTYSQVVIDLISVLHFASFGGMFIKIIYFLLAMLTGFMIISGVLIWRTARDNARYTYKQRRFHHRVTKVYLAFCLSLFPAFALLFIFNKVVPMEMAGRVSTVNGLFFSTWLVLIVLGLFWNNYSRLFKRYLVIGGITALFIPIANGLVTGDWFWQVWNTLPRVAWVDLYWIGAGISALVLGLYLIKAKSGSDAPLKEVSSGTQSNAIKAKPAIPLKTPQPQLAFKDRP